MWQYSSIQSVLHTLGATLKGSTRYQKSLKNTHIALNTVAFLTVIPPTVPSNYCTAFTRHYLSRAIQGWCKLGGGMRAGSRPTCCNLIRRCGHSQIWASWGPEASPEQILHVTRALHSPANLLKKSCGWPNMKWRRASADSEQSSPLTVDGLVL